MEIICPEEGGREGAVGPGLPLELVVAKPVTLGAEVRIEDGECDEQAAALADP